MRLPVPFLLVALASSLPAQNTIVSPAGFDVLEGDSNNVFPFGSTPRRYMQIHNDLGNTPLVITKLTFRVNAGTTNYTGTRTHDMEVYMGEGLPTSQSRPNLLFDANYAAPKQLVLPRQFVTWGPTGQAVSPGPNPFLSTLEINLATPFVYTGALPLIWEVVYYGSTQTGTMSIYDADASTSVTGASTITGTGCAATGSSTLMTHSYTVNDTTGTLLMNGTISNGPPNAPALMAIGFTNPNLPVPGLCANLYTDAVLVQFLGLTSGTGAYTADNATGAIIVPNVFAGIGIFTQAFVLDPLSTAGIPLTASNGRSAVVPSPGTAQVNLMTRLWSGTNGPTSPNAVFATSTVGYGLVTQFTHL